MGPDNRIHGPTEAFIKNSWTLGNFEEVEVSGNADRADYVVFVTSTIRTYKI
jgi:hypothetical protein